MRPRQIFINLFFGPAVMLILIVCYAFVLLAIGFASALKAISITTQDDFKRKRLCRVKIGVIALGAFVQIWIVSCLL